MPMISVDSADEAREFYVEKLGFEHMMGMLGKDGRLDFCTVTTGVLVTGKVVNELLAHHVLQISASGMIIITIGWRP
jgi:hypothetical protein